MAILNQLITPEEFARLGQEEQEIIKSFVTAGGSVAELFDDAKVPVTEVDNPRFLRKFGPQLKEALANTPGLEEAKAKLIKRY
jgi:hypothetical protein